MTLSDDNPNFMKGFDDNPFLEAYPDLKLPDGRLTFLCQQALLKYAGGDWADLGAFLGRSAMILALKADKVVAIDVFHADKVEPEKNNQHLNYYFKVVKEYLPSNVELIKGDVDNVCEHYDDEHFDGVFIDANHSYESVMSNFTHWLPKVKPGGIIIFHDYWDRWSGVVEAVDEILAQGEAHEIEQMGWCKITKKVK